VDCIAGTAQGVRGGFGMEISGSAVAKEGLRRRRRGLRADAAAAERAPSGVGVDAYVTHIISRDWGTYYFLVDNELYVGTTSSQVCGCIYR
jgi:hypothetical protein